MKSITLEQKTFLETNKIFTTSKASQIGLGRHELRKLPGVISLGAFPMRLPNGKTRLENIWTNDPKLVELVKQSKKLIAKGKLDTNLIAEIENIVREKLGFDFDEEAKENEPNEPKNIL